jgi:hypothetical protein
MDITKILDSIMDLNINSGVYTTYDRSVADSVRVEIVRKLAVEYGCDYHPHLRPSQQYPKELSRHAKNP